MNKLGKSFGERRSVHPLFGERERETQREKEFSRRQDLEDLSMMNPRKFPEEVFSLQENLRY
jgi:hypothetical protein